MNHEPASPSLGFQGCHCHPWKICTFVQRYRLGISPKKVLSFSLRWLKSRSSAFFFFESPSPPCMSHGFNEPLRLSLLETLTGSCPKASQGISASHMICEKTLVTICNVNGFIKIISLLSGVPRMIIHQGHHLNLRGIALQLPAENMDVKREGHADVEGRGRNTKNVSEVKCIYCLLMFIVNRFIKALVIANV